MHPSRPSLPKIYGTQIGLQSWQLVDQIKADMLAGRFLDAEKRACIAGLCDQRGVYYVEVGHYRMVAALEIYKETGNADHVLELIRHGRWAYDQKPPHNRRPLPARNWWGAFRHWLGW